LPASTQPHRQYRERTDAGMIIAATDIHLPRRIGEAIKRPYRGTLEIHFDDAAYFMPGDCGDRSKKPVREGRALTPYLSRPLPDALPETGFLVEAVELGAAKIAARDNAENHGVMHNRQVTATDILHQAQRVDRILARSDGLRIWGHNFAQRRFGRVLAFGQNAGHGVAASENAGQPALIVHNQNGPDAAIAHVTGSL